jgi:hypothetical protein
LYHGQEVSPPALVDTGTYPTEFRRAPRGARRGRIRVAAKKLWRFAKEKLGGREIAMNKQIPRVRISTLGHLSNMELELES